MVVATGCRPIQMEKMLQERPLHLLKSQRGKVGCLKRYFLMKAGLFRATLVAVLVGVVSTGLLAEDDSAVSSSDEPLSVELFDAVDSGQVEVHVTAHSYAQVSLRVRNKTDRILAVQLPDVFAAVPVPKLSRRQRSLSVPNNNVLGQGNSQGVGGSLADLGQPVSDEEDEDVAEVAAKGQGAVLTIAAKKTVTEKVDSFCLEFGKPDPNRRISYKLVRLEDFNEKAALRELLREYGAGECQQRVAQLAIWHVANGVPWERLAHIRLGRSPGGGRRTFSEDEVLAAQKLVTSLPSYQQPSLGDSRGT